MSAVRILAAKRDSCRIDLDGTMHTVSRRAVAVALAWMDESCEVSHRLGTSGPRLPLGVWQRMADAMRETELVGRENRWLDEETDDGSGAAAVGT